MMKIKAYCKKLLRRGEFSSESYIAHLRDIGCRIGKGTIVFSKDVLIDETRPWLIEIGSNVQITHNTTILTHGYDWSVLKGKYGDILGSSGKVKIGNNVFIGMNSTILKGTTIGDNVIIGANSLVSGEFPSDCVIAGNPARIICSIDEYYEKRKARQIDEAKELAKEYYSVYGKIPPQEVFHEFFWIFSNENWFMNDIFNNMMNLVGNYEMSVEKIKQNNPQFDSYEDFISFCGLNDEADYH